MENKFSKGAEWRKWDLHVHTPKSIYQKFGIDDDATWEEYLTDLESLSDDYAVLGINDYLFIDGYEKLIHEQKVNNRLQKLKLLPVLEFRIEKFAGIDFQNLKRINLHVIFSDELNIETIKSQFLNTLEQHYYLEKDHSRWARAITRESVEELGAKLKETVPPEELKKFEDNITEGFNNLNVKEDQIFESLKKDCFKDKYLIAIGKTEWADLKWTEASIATKKSIINQADIVFTASQSYEAFNNAKNQLTKQEVNNLLLDCSDAHYLSSHTDKDRIGNCFTWLKADPTFEGLKQIINEPEGRIFIGETPPIRTKVQDNRTKYIKSISIKGVNGYDGRYGKWFNDIVIPLNHELVAIIGNKGSGKSAISDIIALCGFYKNQEHFSFLNKKKFRDGKHAKNFEAILTWESENTNPKNLADEKTEGEIELVKYLPQGYFEKLTNEISSTEEFQKEIENVVFTHLDNDDKVGFNSFEDLIESKKKLAEKDITLLKEDNNELNTNIIKLENKLNAKYKKEIQNKIQLKKDALAALIEPIPVIDPNTDSVIAEFNQISLNKIKGIKSEIEVLEAEINSIQTKKQIILIELRELKELKQDINFKINDIEEFKNQNKEICIKYSLPLDELISVSENISTLKTVIETKESTLTDFKIVLGEQESGVSEYKSAKSALIDLQKALQEEQNKLDGPQKAFQIYLAEKKNWEEKKNKIIGTRYISDSLTFFEFELKYLEESLSTEIDVLREKRLGIAEKIFNKKQQIISVYKDVKQKLDLIIGSNADLLNKYKIDINAALSLSSSFSEIFFRNINQGVLGTFYSIEGGVAELNKIKQDANFDNFENTKLFLNNLNESIHIDQRDKYGKEKRYIDEQIKNPLELYNYLYSIEFLDYNYQLMQGSKTLQQLSPGEKGALLLVFYLLLDKNDIPLIIDQPEDNLDNNSVAHILVPFIRNAKSKRQIILVTHNPNLAIVSDAEQVIYVNLDKEKDNEFTFISGSIENRTVNDCIVKVLEGAMPAFNKRKQKYYEEFIQK
ncbi:MAG TPA: AAA family ATPase [Hanamia sp.]|nr:AAA family ATPase [Hanamia sp.]